MLSSVEPVGVYNQSYYNSIQKVRSGKKPDSNVNANISTGEQTYTEEELAALVYLLEKAGTTAEGYSQLFDLTYIDVIDTELSEAIPELDDNKNYAFVIDGFNNTMDFNFDGVGDISHGDIVAGFIRDINPYVEIIALDVSESHLPDAGISSTELDAALDAVAGVVRNGDFVNLSLAGYLPNGVFTDEELQDFASTYSTTVKIENLIAQGEQRRTDFSDYGVNVAIAAGNNGPDYLNAIALAQNAVTVGALDIAGEQTDYSCTYGVDAWKQGDYNINFYTDDELNILGYDLLGDGDIEMETGIEPGEGEDSFDWLAFIQGTSFAAPTWVGDESLADYVHQDWTARNNDYIYDKSRSMATNIAMRISRILADIHSDEYVFKSLNLY